MSKMTWEISLCKFINILANGIFGGNNNDKQFEMNKKLSLNSNYNNLGETATTSLTNWSEIIFIYSIPIQFV